MSGQHRPNLSRIEQAAIGWIQKLASGKATAEDIANAERWRAQDPLHAKSYEDAEHLWRDMAEICREKQGDDADFTGMLQEYGRRRAAMTRRAALCVGVAAIGGAAAYSVVNPPVRLWPSLSELRADFRTGTGEQRTIAFAGDVEIALNTQTSLAIPPATATEDRVQLIAGEASFAPRNRTARALAVLAANGRIVSESGRFDVRCLSAGDRVDVTCFEGRLNVESGTKIAELLPGQRVSYDNVRVSEIAVVNPQAESEWRRGVVTFRSTRLTDAVDEMNRYRPGLIVLRNSALGQELLSGRFRIDRMEEALVQIEHIFGASVSRFPGGIVVLS